MAYESLDWVETPSETTPYDYTANLAVMGSSIENKVGRFVYSAEGTATLLDTANFEPYTPGNVIKCIREGKMVSVSTTWAVKTPGYIEPQDSRIFAQLPAGFRPKERVARLMQGSGTSQWLMIIGTDGKMSASRCSANQIAHYWMPINEVFIGED